MILPYLATVLLILATIYSAIVSFRQTPENGNAKWLFPASTNRLTRTSVVVLTVLLCAGLWFGVHSRTSPPRSLRFLIPEGYTGWVRVEFEVSGAPPLPSEGGQTVLRIPPDGQMKTSSPEQFGWAKDSYYFYSDRGARVVPDSGPGRLIWGKINGEAQGPSGTRQYEEFFVGTEQQFKDQALK